MVSQLRILPYRPVVLGIVTITLIATGFYLVFRTHAATLQGDINGDGMVNVSDLSILASNYNQSGRTLAQGDLTGDGLVNVFDLSMLAANWAKTGGTGPNPPLPAGVSECPASAKASTMATLANQDRAQIESGPALTQNADLNEAARTHAIWMAVNNKLAHDGWDTEIANSGYQIGSPGAIGQNIAEGFGNAAAVESAWINEVPPNDGHRLNILNLSFHNIGTSCVVENANGAMFWVQDFGS